MKGTLLTRYSVNKSNKVYTVPSIVDIIDSESFCLCKNLESVIIQNGLTSIRPKAFQYCSNLKSVTLLSTLKIIAFSDCKGLNFIKILKIEQNFCVKY